MTYNYYQNAQRLRQASVTHCQFQLDFTSPVNNPLVDPEFLPLLPNIRKNGFDYTLVNRVGDVCIYGQQVAENLTCYEVFIVRVKEASVFKDKQFPRREVFPADEDFGSTAWSCRSLEDALRRKRLLLKHHSQV